jgi:Zn-dependent M28 family amino/carboxypeptidase
VAAVPAQSDALERTQREVCERLAPIDTTACSPGEREAAEWIAARLRRAGVAEVALEEEPSWGGAPPTLVVLGALGMASAALVLANRRISGALLAAASIAGVLDEAENGPRIVRRALRRRRTTVNVVARVDNPGADRTLVVLAHHDAAQTGRVFDQTLQRRLSERFPGLLRRVKTQPPIWWIGVAGPLAAVLGATSGRRAAAVTGVALGGLATCVVADVMRSPTVPGANDNLSGVALIVALAELLRDRPIPGLRVVLLSAGAEETLQDGIRGFMARHRFEFEPDRTWMLNFDAIGSPRLIMLEGEGPFWMQDYTDPSFRDLIARCAVEQGITLERGFRARASTDSVITSRAGYPSACLCALNEWHAMSNYHLMTDTPDNLDYGTIADATRIAYAVAHHLSHDFVRAAKRET